MNFITVTVKLLLYFLLLLLKHIIKLKLLTLLIRPLRR